MDKKANVQLQLQNEFSQRNPKVGNSYFQDDIWDLTPLVTNNQTPNSVKKLDFTFCESPVMKETLKNYAYYLLGVVSLLHVYKKIYAYLRVFINEYCSKYNIDCFSQLNTATFKDFAEYIRNKPNKRNNGKPLAPFTCFRYVNALEELIKVGQIKGWDVPKENLFANINSAKLFLKEAYKQMDDRKYKEIPQDIFNKIINSAMYLSTQKRSTNQLKKGPLI
ncbi:hypothetical protein RJD24_19590 [Bacillaceae bacterium IKA-2]|nr:hypothetical protein RJD24_19590 [Bacillaceae bacterium IKA-2]